MEVEVEEKKNSFRFITAHFLNLGNLTMIPKGAFLILKTYEIRIR